MIAEFTLKPDYPLSKQERHHPLCKMEPLDFDKMTLIRLQQDETLLLVIDQ